MIDIFKIMKNRFLLFFLLICSAAVQAQTIHWIIFGDTTDPLLGREPQNSIDAFTSQFVERIDDAMQAKGYSSRRHTYTGANFSEAKCSSFLNGLTCSEKDIVFFLYIGHGARAYGDANYDRNHQWPDLRFKSSATNTSKEYLALDAIHNRLKSKPHKLVVTIGMCCNNENSTHLQHKGTSLQPYKKRYKIVSKGFAKRIQRWLAASNGDVLVSASSPGQPAYGGFEYGGTEIDCFTGALCEVMDGYSLSESNEQITWANFLQKVASKCSANARSTNGEIQTVKKFINISN